MSTRKMLGLLMVFLMSFQVYAANIMSPGDAAVTGFSETLKKATADSELFDLDGPSVRVITLPGGGNFGLVNAMTHFTIKARDVGQVFGIVLDGGKQPNIYVAATSAYGLAIQNDNGRLKKGANGAKYVVGQFGASGGSTSIWKIDGNTGAVSLFANVGTDNSPAALGALAYDSKTQQIFVSDRATGLIHRFSMDGTDKGTYDHGVNGRPAASLESVALDAKTSADIHKDTFDTEDPKTWGYAPPERRVFALAVNGDRLYYSVYGPQVWSVGINADGSFKDDPRVEVDAPALAADTEISSILFDKNGLMYTAERGAPTGDYSFVNVAHSGDTRVKRYQPQQPTEQSPYLWTAPGDEYAIAMPAEYQNANGGVALTCGRTLWSTADSLVEKEHVNGIQGNDVDLVKPKNSPPTSSWFVNYYDYKLDERSQGTIGAMVILYDCGIPKESASSSSSSSSSSNVPSYSYPLPPVPPDYSCPPGSTLIDSGCLYPPRCPPGSVFSNGTCLFPQCDWGYVFVDGVCITPPMYCPWGTVYYNNYCVPVFCPPPFEYARNGYCRCPFGTYFYKNHCEPAPRCKPNELWIDGFCIPQRVCRYDEIMVNGWCIRKPLCPKEQVWRNGHCECPMGQKYVDGHCKPDCKPNEKLSHGHCVQACPTDQKYINGNCISSHLCTENQIWKDNQCVNKPVTTCPSGQVLERGVCVVKPVEPVTPQCPKGQVYRNGHCTTIYKKPVCGKGQVYRKGHCVYVNVYQPPKVNVYRPPHINIYIPVGRPPHCGGGGGYVPHGGGCGYGGGGGCGGYGGGHSC